MNSKDEEEEEEEEEDGAKEAAAHECEASGGSGDEKERERATPTTRITLTDSYMAIWPSTLALPTPHSSPGGAGWRCVLVRSVELCSAVLVLTCLLGAWGGPVQAPGARPASPSSV